MKSIVYTIIFVATLTACNKDKNSNTQGSASKNQSPPPLSRVEQINRDNNGLIDYRQVEGDKLNGRDYMPDGESFAVMIRIGSGGFTRIYSSDQPDIRFFTIKELKSNNSFPFTFTVNCDNYTFIENQGKPEQTIEEAKPGTVGATWAYLGCNLPVAY